MLEESCYNSPDFSAFEQIMHGSIWFIEVQQMLGGRQEESRIFFSASSGTPISKAVKVAKPSEKRGGIFRGTRLGTQHQPVFLIVPVTCVLQELFLRYAGHI